MTDETQHPCVQNWPGQVDLTGVKQHTSVWMVKVPKYLSRQWQKAPEGGEVGKLQVRRIAQREAQVRFISNKEPAAFSREDDSVSVPCEHTFTAQPLRGQTMAVFSQNSSDEIELLGTVVQKMHCKAAFMDEYLQIKRSEIKKAPRTTKQLEMVPNPVINYKPVAKHSYHREAQKKRREGVQKMKADKQAVLDMLFSAFEKRQYYSIKQLVDLTNQPVLYLKKILRDIGTYQIRGGHKYTWGLKPEYRCYGGST